MGCAYDSFSPSWKDRSYILVLLVFFWLIPIVTMVFCYTAMINRVRKADLQYIPLRRLRSTGSAQYNLEKRVTLIKMKMTYLTTL